MESYSCRGLKRLAVKPSHNPSHDDARRNRGQNVKEKVLHNRANKLRLRLRGGRPPARPPEQFQSEIALILQYIINLIAIL
jgi:hypothetical protein